MVSINTCSKYIVIIDTQVVLGDVDLILLSQTQTSSYKITTQHQMCQN
uniref:Uncharacterized protein n=1 Tax=Arundo donax TaxID=35708 RepID=A0A0A9CS40_ARUDO